MDSGLGHGSGLVNMYRHAKLVNISCFCWTFLLIIFIVCTPGFELLGLRGSAVGRGVADLVPGATKILGRTVWTWTGPWTCFACICVVAGAPKLRGGECKGGIPLTVVYSPGAPSA